MKVPRNFTTFTGEDINKEFNAMFEVGASSGRVFRCVRDPQSEYENIIELLKDENRDDDRCIGHLLLLCAVCLGCKDFFTQRHLR